MLSIEMSERKAYTSALLRLRTAEAYSFGAARATLTPLPQPREAGMSLLESEYRCALEGNLWRVSASAVAPLSKMS